MSVKRLSMGLVGVLAISGAVGVEALPGAAEEKTTVSHLRDRLRKKHERLQQPAKSVKDWVAQIEAATVQVTGVKLEQTEYGLDIVLETAENKPLQVDATKFRREGNRLVADIPNTVLALPQGQSFTAENPTADIATVQVVQQGSQIQVSVAGKEVLPKTEVTLRTGDLAYSLNAEEDEADDEIVVTGEREGYRVPNTAVGTRTDTPLRDIPQAINVVPQQVIRDTQSRSITEALENVPGVVALGNDGAAGTRDYFTIRGFEVYSNSLVNGLPDPQISSDGIFFNVQQIEVLKGPASILYGDTGFSGIGGTINYVTKQPLSDPLFEVSATAGNYNFYQTVLDASGPLNAQKTVLYRLIGGFRFFDSIIDFNAARAFAIAPSLSVKIDSKTNLTLEGDVNVLERNGQQPGSIPVVGTVRSNPNGKISRSFNPVGPTADNLTVNGRVGYRLEHDISDNWKVRNTFRYTFASDDDEGVLFNPTSLEADNRTLNRDATLGSQFYDYLLLDTNFLGKFKTGTIEHQLLVGSTFSYNRVDLSYEFGVAAAPVDIFNPVYDQSIVRGEPNFAQVQRTNTLGIYLQNQITLLPNLKLLLGGRFDTLRKVITDRLSETDTSQSDTAFSPRVGIVYQPIPAISLYASYSRSFAPTIGVGATGETFQPERGTQYEVGIKADVTQRLTATLAYYDLTRSNVTTTDPTNSIFSVQTGQQKSRGVEFDITGEILPGWNIIAGYAYTDARVTEDNDIPVGNQLFNVPKNAANLWTTYRIQTGNLRGLGFGLGLYYLGERPADTANTIELPSFWRTDAAIFYERDQLRVALNIRNIFDVENYKSSFGSSDFVDRGTPFTLQGSISWRF